MGNVPEVDDGLRPDVQHVWDLETCWCQLQGSDGHARGRRLVDCRRAGTALPGRGCEKQ